MLRPPHRLNWQPLLPRLRLSPLLLPILTPLPTFTPVPPATLALAAPARLPIPNATASPNVVRIGEIKGYGYAPLNVRNQAVDSDLIARVRHVSAEPSFRINSGADPEYRYRPYAHFSFSIIEPLKGTPAGDVVVVEYSLYSGMPTKAQAIEEAKKWIASERDVWWNKREAIIFLDDLRFAGGKVSEISSGAYYSFANHFRCDDHSMCTEWGIRVNNSYANWVWLPFIGEDASLEVPDSERMFRVVVDPYEVDSYGYHASAFASLADIKAILETYGADGTVARRAYVGRQLLLWEAKGSDSYSFVSSGVDDGGRTFFPAIKIVVRNGEVVEAFFAEDVDRWGKVWPAGSRIEPEKMNGYGSNLPTLETLFWFLAEMWASGHQLITDVSFDYEFGYPTAIRLKSNNGTESFAYASDYTPLDD